MHASTCDVCRVSLTFSHSGPLHLHNASISWEDGAQVVPRARQVPLVGVEEVEYGDHSAYLALHLARRLGDGRRQTRSRPNLHVRPHRYVDSVTA